MERFTPDMTLACGVLQRALVDLSIRKHALPAAKFLARDWRQTWGHYLPQLRPSRLRALVLDALEAPPASDALDRHYRPPTRSQRAQQKLILAPLLRHGVPGLAQTAQIQALAGRVCVDQRPERGLEGASAPEPVTYAPGRCSDRRCRVGQADEFCRRPVCHRSAAQLINTEERMATRA